MIKRQGLIFICLLILFFSANTFALTVVKTTIEINIARNGWASIKEIYNLRFLAGEKTTFAEDYRNNGSDLILWKAKYPFFYPHVFENEISSSSVTYLETKSQLILEYTLTRQLAIKENETAREEMWVIPVAILKKFQIGGTIVIPTDTEIIINLPAGSEIPKENLPAEIEMAGRTLRLSGISTSFINLRYVIKKPIAPPVNSMSIINESNILIAISAILLTALIVYWQRKPLCDKIEKFVIENSEITPKATEEEIEVEA